MNNRLIAYLLALAATTVTPAAAQGTLRPLPPGMQWVVEISPPGEIPGSVLAPKLPSDPIREENALSGQGLRKETRFFRDGSNLTRFAMGDRVLYYDARTDRVEIDAVGDEIYGGPISTKDFSELNWVNRTAPSGQKTIDGVLCDVYQSTGPGLAMTAYIGKQTRLPVRLETPAEVRRYVFSPLASPLTLPPEYRAAIERLEAALKWRKQRFRNPDAPIQ
jgi:hypothetical protein